jgi:O-antigen/teichoic acid export membrane protein
MAVLLPLALRHLSAEEVVVWQLLVTLVWFQILADLGMTVTFTRCVAYAMGGAERISDHRERTVQTTQTSPNWELLKRLMRTVHAISLWAALAFAAIAGAAGTLALVKPVAAIGDPVAAWTAWGITLTGTVIVIGANGLLSWLQGTNHVAHLRRWQAVTSTVGTLGGIAAILLGAGIVGIVAATQTAAIVGILVNWSLSRSILDGWIRTLGAPRIDLEILRDLWPASWRTWIGMAMAAATTQLTGILAAQWMPAPAAATYLLGLRLIQFVSTFSQAPFYSKIPLLARLLAQGDEDRLKAVAAKGMTLSLWCFVIGFLILAIAGTPLLELIGSNVTFPDRSLWLLFGIAFLVERGGAMHLQLYSTTNHIVWHVANGIAGIIMVIAATVLYPSLASHGFVLAIGFGYVVFYLPYSLAKTLRRFALRLPREIMRIVLPLATLILVSICIEMAMTFASPL